MYNSKLISGSHIFPSMSEADFKIYILKQPVQIKMKNKSIHSVSTRVCVGVSKLIIFKLVICMY